MSEYIEREALLQDIAECVIFSGRKGHISPEIIGANKVIDRIKRQPIVDAVPAVHGKWVDIFEHATYCPDMKSTIELTEQKCSNCRVVTTFKGAKPYLPDNYCPNCGAKMNRGEKNDK